MNEPGFDAQKAHRFFSAGCFNGAWKLIDKADRTREQDERMLLAAMASLWHWTHRDDVAAANLSVGYWQVSRIHAVLGRADEARRYGVLSLDAAREGEPDPFTLGYAHEALARAEALAGNATTAAEHFVEARKAAEAVTDEESKQWLLDDLATIA